MQRVTLETINKKLDYLIEREMEKGDEVLSDEVLKIIEEGMEDYRKGRLNTTFEDIERERKNNGL